MNPLVPHIPIHSIHPRTGATVCALLAAAACAFAQPNTQKMILSSVTVYGMTNEAGELKPAMRGGGVVLGPRHVLADVDMCCSRTDKGEPLIPQVALGGYRSGARMVWRSPDSDIVILELERPIDLQAASIAPSNLTSNGLAVYTVNFPLAGDAPKINEGKLTDRKKFPQKGLSLHAATTPMERLNTGGGLFDSCGNVVGITVQFKEGELLAWFIDGAVPGLKDVGIKLEVAGSQCGGGSGSGSGGGSGSSGGGSSGGGAGGGTGGGGTSGGATGSASGTGTSVGNFFSKLTTAQWIAIGVIVGIFALGFRPATRQQVVRAMTRRRSLPEPLPYPYGGQPPPPAPFGAPGPPPVGPPPVGPPPVGPPPVFGGMPPPVYPPPVAPYQPPGPPAPLLAGRPAIVGLAGQYAGASIALDSGPSTMGRDHSNVNLVFPPEANAISKRHCRVSWDIARRVFVLEDLGSTNGTFLASGERVNPGQPRDLRPGDRFYIGDLRNQFEVKMES